MNFSEVIRHYFNIAQMVFAVLVTASAAQAEATKVAVYRSGEDGYHTYRIPAIVQATNGELLAFAEGRKTGPGDVGDIDIVLKRSSDGGRTWDRMQLVQDEWDDPSANVWISNPTPVLDLKDSKQPGRIWLAFTRNHSDVFVTHSDDHGATWSERRDISRTAADPSWDWCATGPVHGIQLERGEHAGRLILPCNHGKYGRQESWGAHLLYSDDHGATWGVGAIDTREVGGPLHPNECVAVELVDGRIYVNAREQYGSDPATRSVARSSDGGLTFDSPFAPEPKIATAVVQNSAVRFAATDRGDERNVLVYSCLGLHPERQDLTILISFDEGTSWTMRWILHRGWAAYSDLITLNSQKIGVLYEAGEPLYSEIVFATFGIDDLEPRR